MKTFNNIRTTIIVLSLSMIMVGCSLNLEPISIITNASFWKTEDDINGALTGAYIQLRAVAAQDLFLLGEGRSEVLSQGVVGTAGFDVYYLNTLTASTNAGPDWRAFYSIVNTCNLILKYSSNVSFKTEASKNRTLAQAYAMRAYVYFVMTRSWGDLIIHTEPIESTSPDVIYRERSSQADVFKLIKEDINKSVEMFPDNAFSSGRCAWSKPAVLAIKAEVYLWTGKRMKGGNSDFETALSALNEIKHADVTLLEDYTDIFKYQNKGNKEILMSSRFADLESSQNFFWQTWLIAGSIPENVDQETKDILFPIGGGQGLIIPSIELRKQFASDDTRRKGTFHEIYTYDPTGKATYYTSVALKGAGLVKDGTRLYLSDIILYRYADVLLMMAEAKNALGQDPSIEINMIRKRAYNQKIDDHLFTDGGKADNDAAILKERLLELSFEGKRWWDLVRIDKAFDLVPSLQNRKGQDYLMLYPISNGILSLEPKVKQNPGWE